MQLTSSPQPWPPPRMTRRKREVLDLLARGFTNAAIASELGISFDGAKWHVAEVMGSLGFESRREAGHWWQHVEQGHA